MLTGLMRIFRRRAKAKPQGDAAATSRERVAFERARLDYCMDIFNREEERREQLERKAQFYLSFITLILGALFFQADNLTLLSDLVGNEAVAPPIVTLTYITIVLLGLAILFSILAILGVTRLWSYRSPFPKEIVDSLFSPDSKFIQAQKQEDFLRAAALNFAIALDTYKSVNDRKSKWIVVSSYGIFFTVALLAILLAFIVYLSIAY